MKVLSASDLHLGNFNPYNKETKYYGVGTRLLERLEAVRCFFEYGKERNITHYVFNGDIFDKRQKEDIRTIEFIINRIVDSFSKTPKGSTLYLNIGNHDEQSRYLNPNSCELFRNIHVVNHKIVIVDKLSYLIKLKDKSNLLFVPFTENIKESKIEVNKTISVLDNPTTIFAHIGLNNSHTGRYKLNLDGDYNLNDLGYDNKYIKNIVLGHYHTRDFHKGKSDSDEKSVWYQGNILPMSFNDVDKNGFGSPRGFDEIDTLTGEHTFINLCGKPYNFSKFDIVELENTNLTADEIVSLSKKDYVKIVSTEMKKEDIKHLDNSDNIKVTIKPKLDDEQVEIDIKKDDSFEDILKKYCDLNSINKNVYKKSLEIIKKSKELL